MTKRALALMIGSGMSKGAGLRLASELTEYLLTDCGYFFHSNQQTYLGPPSPASEDAYCLMWHDARYLQAILRMQRDILKKHLRREPNYEDLIEFASGDSPHETDRGQGASVIRDVRNCVNLQLESVKHPWRASPDVARAATIQMSLSLIRELLAINQASQFPGPFKIVADAIRYQQDTPTCILTTNHDELIEKLLDDNKIPYCDGFFKDCSSRWRWDGNLFQDEGQPVKLVKVHGSVGWGFFDDKQGALVRVVGPITEMEVIHRQTQPVILTGTWRKNIAYGRSPLYGEMKKLFDHYLQVSEHLVITGYGFADSGINVSLSDWLCEPAHRAVVVNPEITDGNDLSARLRGEANLDNVSFIRRKAEETSWADISKALEAS